MDYFFIAKVVVTSSHQVKYSVSPVSFTQDPGATRKTWIFHLKNLI